jgi:hypothetical protein
LNAAPYFRCVQLDVPGRLGLDDGRYLLRDEEDREQAVMVVQTIGVAAPAPRRARRRRPRLAQARDPAEVPLTRLTMIPAQRIARDAARNHLASVRADHEALEDEVAEALRAANSILRAHRIATADPYGHEIGRDAPLAVRVGYGTGSELAEGRWEEAIDVPPPERRQRRREALRPQERLAAVLGGRERIDACETLLLRARADLDQGRTREGALQLRAGLDAMLAELPGRAGPDQEEDLAALGERRERVSRIAEEALRGGVGTAGIEKLNETLRICERVLRRRQILSDRTQFSAE